MFPGYRCLHELALQSSFYLVDPTNRRKGRGTGVSGVEDWDIHHSVENHRVNASDNSHILSFKTNHFWILNLRL